MIYVSHRLDEIFRIADRVAVLRDGVLVGVRSIEHTTPEELVQKIVGRKTRPKRSRQRTSPARLFWSWKASAWARSALWTSRLRCRTRLSASSGCAVPGMRR